MSDYLDQLEQDYYSHSNEPWWDEDSYGGLSRTDLDQFENLDDVAGCMHVLPFYDQCLVHRVLYYCLAQPVLSDWEYDMLERRCTTEGAEDCAPPNHPLWKPGSDREENYPPRILRIAYLITFPMLR